MSQLLALPGYSDFDAKQFEIVPPAIPDWFAAYLRPKVKIHVLSGGVMPTRQTDGAIGYDVSLRALVCPFEKDPNIPALRKMLFDFKKMPVDPTMAEHVVETKEGLVYRLRPGESVLGGVGFATNMPYPLMYWAAPRSGLASKYHITLGNAPGTVDPDYRGEAGIVIRNSHSAEPFDLHFQMRIAQVMFGWAIIPELTPVSELSELGTTARGSGGFGSTGLR